MKIAGSVALVTGANRGIGRELAATLLERGASKVYAAARTPEKVDLPGVEVLPLDITDPASIAAAAAAAPDVTLLINNAGISTGAQFLSHDQDLLHREMETHFWGTLNVTRAFAPALIANGGGTIANILSALSWFSVPGSSGYSAAKAAEWALTNGLRVELAPHGTQVTGVLLGAADTDIAAGYDGPKISTAQVARVALDGIEAGRLEVIVDDWTAYVKASLAKDPAELYTPAFLRGELGV